MRCSWFYKGILSYTFTMAAVQRGIDDARKIDQSEKNKWSWTWCEKELCDGDDVHLVSDYTTCPKKN